MLSEAKLAAYPRGAGIYAVLFSGSLRPWAVDVRESNGWICVRTQIMTVPKIETARNALLDAVSRANDRISLCKFAVAWGDQLVIDLEYFRTHVDAQTLSRLVWLVESIAEQEYPHLLDIARASETLNELEGAFRRSPPP